MTIHRGMFVLLFIGVMTARLAWIMIPVGFYVIYFLYDRWKKIVFQKLNCEVHFEPSRVHVDQEGTMMIRLRNLSWLPIHVKVEFLMDPKVEMKTTFHPLEAKNRVIVHFLMSPNSTVVKRIPFFARHRGLFWLDDLQLVIKDPLGLSEVKKELELYPQLIAYPKSFPVQEMSRIMRQAIGDTLSTERLLQEDQAFYAGARPYQLGDPFKRLDWKATARRQTLQTKVYDYTVHGKVYFLMDPPPTYTNDEEQKINWERWIGILTTFISYCHKKGIIYRMLINSSFRYSKKFTETPWSSGRKHFISIMELLAKLKVNKWVTFPALTQQIEREGNKGSGVVVLKHQWTAEDWASLKRLEQQGYHVFIVNLTEHSSRLDTLSSMKKDKGGPNGLRVS